MGELPHHHEDRKRLERLRSFIQEPESFQEVANLCRLLSDNSRVRIFWLLCHCEECVMNLSALVGMSSPAVSHHLRQLKDSGLIVSRRVGKEVYYRAADTEVAQLLHQIIERTVEVTCPQSDSQLVSGAPHLPPLDQHDYCGSCPAEQLEVIRQVHRFLTEHLDSRITIEQLSRQFLMNPSTMKELFKEVYLRERQHLPDDPHRGRSLRYRVRFLSGPCQKEMIPIKKMRKPYDFRIFFTPTYGAFDTPWAAWKMPS